MKIINYNKEKNKAIDTAVNYLQNGSPIVFPTETVYGLGAIYDNEKAVNQIYEIKKREQKKPLALHIASLENLNEYAIDIPDIFYKLAEKFLPGPLAIILKKNNSVGNYITGNIITGDFQTISIRYPDCQAALDIINALDKPIAATSVNISGEPALTTPKEIIAEFRNSIPLIIDAGKSKIGKASTVISLAQGKLEILRIGSIPEIDIRKIVS